MNPEDVQLPTLVNTVDETVELILETLQEFRSGRQETESTGKDPA